jgi:ubiquitin carboxyl-terminal hydrolase 8
MTPDPPAARGFFFKAHPRAVYRTDYEVVDLASWEEVTKLLNLSGTPDLTRRPFIYDHTTGSPTVIMNPVQVGVRIDGDERIIDGDLTWTMDTLAARIAHVCHRELDFVLQQDTETLHTAVNPSDTVSEAIRSGHHFLLRPRLPIIPFAAQTRKLPLLAKPHRPPSVFSIARSIDSSAPSIAAKPIAQMLTLPLSNPDAKSVSARDTDRARPLPRLSGPVSLRPLLPAAQPKAVGLTNLGNTCFFNASVQCLLRVVPLTSFVLSDAFELAINPRNKLGAGGDIARAWRAFVTSMSRGGAGARDPTDLRHAITTKYPRFAGFSQQDAQELLGVLLDGLHEDLNQSRAVGGSVPLVSVRPDADSWDLHVARNSSVVMALFHGKLYSRVECPDCGHVEAVFDPFQFLSLEIPKPSRVSVSLGDCLREFSRGDRLDEDNKSTCGRCRKKVRAVKRIGVQSCPQLLIVHLKRFSALRYRKVDTPVDYPDLLESGSFAVEPSGSYRLFAAVFHTGGMNGGHYTAAAIDLESGKWCMFNDAMASPIESGAAHKPNAYLLFYQRMGG